MTAMLEAVAPAPPGFELTYKQYLDEVLWQRVTVSIVKERGHSPELAERILNQTVAYLLFRAQITEEGVRVGSELVGYPPSVLVDDGWHAFMSYQKELEDFLLQSCGRMIYHAPHDDPRVDYAAQPCGDTAQALRDRGYVVDDALWAVRASTCDGYGGNQTPPGISV